MKTAIIKVITYDYFDQEDYVVVHKMPLGMTEMEELSKFDADHIRKFLHDNCVGLHDSISENKFIPCIEIGKLCVSCQINYQVWKLRTDKVSWNDESYNAKMEENVTEEEFNAVLPDNDKYMDVAVSYDGARCYLGQMTINEVASIFSDILYNLKIEFQD